MALQAFDAGVLEADGNPLHAVVRFDQRKSKVSLGGNAINTHVLQAEDVVHLFESRFDGRHGRWSARLNELLQRGQSFGNGIDRAADFARFEQRPQGNGEIVQPQRGSATFDPDHPTDGIWHEALRRSRDHQILVVRKHEDLVDPLQPREIEDFVGDRLPLGKAFLNPPLQFHQRHQALVTPLGRITHRVLLRRRLAPLLIEHSRTVIGEGKAHHSLGIHLDAARVVLIVVLVVVSLSKHFTGKDTADSDHQPQ